MTLRNILAAAALVSLGGLSYANGFFVSAGKAPESEGGGTSLAIIGMGSNNFGFGVGFVFNSEFAGKDVLDYPVPHNNYTNLGTKRTGNSIGLDGYYFFGNSAKFRPYVGAGIYFNPRKEVAQSNATGWYYTQSIQSSTVLSGELGMQFVTDGGLLFGLGIHSVRGANISVGKSF